MDRSMDGWMDGYMGARAFFFLDAAWVSPGSP